MLLAKTLASSTFRLALIAIGTFGIITAAIFAYVYLSTTSYVRGRSDREITTEVASLAKAYESAGRDGLMALIGRHLADPSFADHVYLLVDPRQHVLAGNLRQWPQAAVGPAGWIEFRGARAAPGATSEPLLRAIVQTFPNGDRLLAGLDISDLDQARRHLRRRFDLHACRHGERAGDPPHRGTDRADQRHQSRHHGQRPRPAHPLARQP